LAHAIASAIGAAGFIDQLAERNRGATRLQVQPFPMPRQQRDLTSHNTKFRATRAARLGLLYRPSKDEGMDSEPLNDIVICTAQVQINWVAGRIVKDEGRKPLIFTKRGFNR
jgi:hypothetical protein